MPYIFRSFITFGVVGLNGKLGESKPTKQNTQTQTHLKVSLSAHSPGVGEQDVR